MRETMFTRPAVIPFVECPNCKSLIEFGAEQCSRCREEIDENYALLSAAVVQFNTQACTSANTIKTAEPAIVISIISATWSYFIEIPALFILALATPILFLSTILVWFFRYGRFKIGDEDFLKAKRDMSASLKLWMGLLIVELLVFFYMLKTLPFDNLK